MANATQLLENSSASPTKAKCPESQQGELERRIRLKYQPTGREGPLMTLALQIIINICWVSVTILSTLWQLIYFSFKTYEVGAILSEVGAIIDLILQMRKSKCRFQPWPKGWRLHTLTHCFMWHVVSISPHLSPLHHEYIYIWTCGRIMIHCIPSAGDSAPSTSWES